MGILSERNLLRVLLIGDKQLSYLRGKTVANAMSAEAVSADPVSDMRRIAQAVLNHHLSTTGRSLA